MCVIERRLPERAECLSGRLRFLFGLTRMRAPLSLRFREMERERIYDRAYRKINRRNRDKEFPCEIDSSRRKISRSID